MFAGVKAVGDSGSAHTEARRLSGFMEIITMAASYGYLRCSAFAHFVSGVLRFCFDRSRRRA
jgi:hypothetical protein